MSSESGNSTREREKAADSPQAGDSEDRDRSRPVYDGNGYVLALDTSTASLAVALLRDGCLVEEKHTIVERNHSIHLMPHLQELLASRGIQPKDLAAVVAGQGPGSYTGVRIAVTAAKTFAWSLGIPAAAVSSLEALALGGRTALLADTAGNGADDAVRWFVPLMNARRGQAFTAVYASAGNGPAAGLLGLEGANGGAESGSTGSGWARLQPDGIRLVADFARHIGIAAGGAEAPGTTGAESAGDGGAFVVPSAFAEPQEIVFVGETSFFEEAIGQAAAELNIPVRVLPYDMTAAEVGLLGLDRLKRGETIDKYTFVPNYTQLTEAEVNLMAKAKS
ncbi:tRNA (adenosine(37)-N6)-threonylcarbamoyltransferase complex dimerization subunit type 1 TsaB [Paenibacillus sp. UNC499MF]|uniref:tRNA (adenosine(37)-N6)-threonylcarbamoyltransferase complex dimerization subunit type 1 TsaB n=1 Tax=Paenibacillus sp. UNC499MF TaxID=1502751 RepID=UPI0008A01369|nr:tRNA (adenosine(37)-N6)-threonylcarbamoyltransferase complex dimerization subunit type 1 TsaB [Paenibacillus sp. UNC499MF]SEG69969.1 tRNA threonylcarbamoyladenosine biosynthesis protein TsaB [Paenibacillus sp. UNC499MF]